MSQVVTRANASTEDKEKVRTESPVKDMKKKVAANAEKQKLASEKHVDGQADKSNADKQKEDKSPKKDDKSEKQDPKLETKKSEKPKSGKTNEKNAELPSPVHNGVSDVTLNKNGTPDNTLNGTSVSADSDEEEILIVDNENDDENDELFPELSYDDDVSDIERFESQTPEHLPNRSMTRRSQVKSACTPETPQPVSDKRLDLENCNNGEQTSVDNSNGDGKDTKLLKLQENPMSGGRKLRSSDQNTENQEQTVDSDTKENGSGTVITQEIDDHENSEKDVIPEQRKTDTNYSKSRVKISPYRRSMRIADQSTTSTTAIYAGNDTTMEMDITEVSSFLERPSGSEDPSLNDDSYISSLRNIRGRRSYKLLDDKYFRNIATKKTQKSIDLDANAKKTVHVIGRKRKPVEEIQNGDEDDSVEELRAKRMRFFERVMSPFIRKSVISSTPIRRNVPIKGVNSDLPLNASNTITEQFDPESIKVGPIVAEPVEVAQEESKQRCILQ